MFEKKGVSLMLGIIDVVVDVMVFWLEMFVMKYLLLLILIIVFWLLIVVIWGLESICILFWVDSREIILEKFWFKNDRLVIVLSEVEILLLMVVVVLVKVMLVLFIFVIILD